MGKWYDSALYHDSSNQAIPARIVIGVTGHRKIDNTILLGSAVQSAISMIERMVPELQATPLVLTVLSSLAEGADRYIAREVLKVPGAQMEVLLPMEKTEYVEDFRDEASKKEFEELLGMANNVRRLSLKSSREEAYERDGRYIVEHCDVLIALWDGNPSGGRGGTQEIVQYARETGCPMVWIKADDGYRINYEPGRGIDPRPLKDLDKYNQKKAQPAWLKTRFSNDIQFFSEHIKNSGLALDKTLPVVEYFLRHYIRADKLAMDVRRLYYQTEVILYTFALAAVMIAALQVLFFPGLPIILISEIILMLAVLIIVWISKLHKWHEKWIDYRFLAERFRTTIFIAAVGADVAVLKPPRHLSLAYTSKDWIVTAFTTIWQMKPHVPPDDSPSREKVKKFLGEAWLEDQIRYHTNTSKACRIRHRCLTFISNSLFGLTIAVVIAHVVNAAPHFMENIFAFLAIVFPAIAAGITAIKTHRDYLRISMRYAEMATHLKELKSKMSRIQDRDEFLSLVKEIEETMLRENEDWRVIVRFHETEVPV